MAPLLLSIAIIALSILPNAFSNDLSDLKDARTKWSSLSKAQRKNYIFEFSYLCFCPYCDVTSHTIRVKRGKIDEVSYTKEGDALVDCVDDPAEDGYFLFKVEDLFRKLRAALKGDKPFSFSATYHEVYGYPMEVWVDVDDGIADEEFGFTVSCLTFPHPMEDESHICSDCDVMGCPGKKQIWCKKTRKGVENICKGPTFSSKNPDPAMWTFGSCGQCAE